MLITKMTACFGSLSNETLDLKPGLNIITSPNESGKSTWCAFIKAMLYGVSTSEREKAGYKPDKLKYAPWSGAPMTGELQIVSGEKAITLRRASRAGFPLRDFSAVYTNTANPVPGLDGDGAGEALIGAGRPLFERSAFISQTAMALSPAPELERRVNSLVSTGEEAGTYTETDGLLRQWQRRIKYLKYGELPELENKISESEKKLENGSRRLDELDAAVGEINALTAERDELSKEAAESRRIGRRNALAEMSRAKERFAEEKEREAAAKTAAEAALRGFNSGVFAGKAPDTLRETIGADVSRADTLKTAAGKKNTGPLAAMIISLMLFIVAGAAGFFLTLYILFFPAIIFLAAGIVFSILLIFFRKNQTAANNGLSALYEKYGVTDSAEISVRFIAHEKNFAALKAANEAVEMAANSLAELAESNKELEARLLAELDFSAGASDAARLSRAVADIETRLSFTREKRAALEGSLSFIGDPLIFRTALQNDLDRRAELIARYDALELAQKTLADADDELKSRFSPLLSRRAAEYLSRMTGGKYCEISLSKDMSALIRENGETAVRESAFLSAGTADQVYLALRLAICELTLPEGDPCPLIMDDALCNFDSSRRAEALELLGELAKKRQIILFECR